jgi:hypothetical protein
MSIAAFFNCGTSEQDRPLITLKFQGSEIYPQDCFACICPECLPTLIHKPYQLADKLPEFSPSETHPADDH